MISQSYRAIVGRPFIVDSPNRDGVALKEILKFVCVDLIPAIIVALLGYMVIAWGPGFAKFITMELPEDSHFDLVALIVFALAVYAVARFTIDTFKYVWFVVAGDEKPACGLYIEAYFTNKDGKAQPVISLIVVYFDVRTEQLKIKGHAFVQGEGDKPKFTRHASWLSKALYYEPNKDDFDIFYIHEGSVVNLEKRIRGTTTFDLPVGKIARQGSFCDLKAVQPDLHQPLRKDDVPTLFAATHFNIIRASNEVERIFYGKIGGFWARRAYRRMLSYPREEAFNDFINDGRRDLIKDVPEMTRVWSELKA